MLKDHDIAISMDGKGRWLDNVFVERLWRSVKYEDVYLRAYETPRQLREGLNTTSGSTTLSVVTVPWTDASRMRSTSRRPTLIAPPETNQRFPFSYCPRIGVHFCKIRSLPPSAAALDDALIIRNTHPSNARRKTRPCLA
ncbi:MAG: hypothetical protein ACLFS2_03240 [Halochromatium sp.]